MAAYWLTFKPLGPEAPKGWPVDKLRVLIERFQRDPDEATEWWRIASHKSASIGDRVYLFKQGSGTRGIFGVGEIIEGPELRDNQEDQEGLRHRARVRFTRLVDPTNTLLLALPEIEDVVPNTLINAQASGYRVTAEVAQELEWRLQSGSASNTSSVARETWGTSEVSACMFAYFAMLRHELVGEPYVKAAYNEQVRQATGRSKGSVEFKFANISAVLDDMGLRWIDGYKPRGHSQVGAIRDAINTYLGGQQGLADRLEKVPTAVPQAPSIAASVFTAPPPVSPPAQPGNTAGPHNAHKRDRALSDARNRALGEKGEEWLVEVERQRLKDEGRPDLALKVLHTSKDEGDGAGYDIASWNADGSPRLIEVKTTNGPAETPFYVTANEVRVSVEMAPHYWLYRVYSFSSKEPRIYTLQGALDGKSLKLEPTVYRATR